MTIGNSPYVGIDPGKNGAAVAWFMDSNEIEVCPYSLDDSNNFFAWLVGHCPEYVFLEKAQAMPKNGAVSMFNYGVGFGSTKACVELSEAPWIAVPPAKWTKIMHIGCLGSKPKDKSAEAFKRTFPHIELDGYSKVKREGIIDALLICVYGYRHLLGKRD